MIKVLLNRLETKPLQLWFCILAVNALIWGLFGMFHLKISPDGRGYYLPQAAYIDKNGLLQFCKEFQSVPYYWGFPIFLYCSKAIFGGGFLTAVLLIQFILVSTIPVGLMYIYKRLFCKEGQLLVYTFLLLCLDVSQWYNFLLTDIYSLTMDIAFIVLILKTAQKPSAWRSVGIFLLAIAMIAFRASNLTIIVLSMIYLLYFKNTKIAVGVIMLTIICLIATLITSKNPGTAFSPNNKLVAFINDMKKGEVIMDRHIYNNKPYVDGNSEFFYAVTLYLKRTVAYWQFYIIGFSKGHNLYNLIFFPICYLTALIAIFKRSKKSLSREKIYILAIILACFFFTTITKIDYDWRYRIPVLTLLLIFSARGLVIIYCALMQKGNKAIT